MRGHCARDATVPEQVAVALADASPIQRHRVILLDFVSQPTRPGPTYNVQSIAILGQPPRHNPRSGTRITLSLFQATEHFRARLGGQVLPFATQG
jgi:hypothetical protein